MRVTKYINHINSVDKLHEWYKWIHLFIFTKHFTIAYPLNMLKIGTVIIRAGTSIWMCYLWLFCSLCLQFKSPVQD